MRAAELHTLGALDRTLLHVFVAGPGYGEGLAIALPSAGWLVVDGCQVANEELPLLRILDQWRDPAEAVDCVVLTHPHRDHAAGIRRLIEETLPQRVALSTSPSDPDQVFAAVEDPRQVRPTSSRQRLSHALEALLAIRRYWQERPDTRLALVEGADILTSSSRVGVRVCAPEVGRVEHVIERAARSKKPVERSNELSAVIEVVFGETRVVLGSDLTTLHHDGTPTRSGWAEVLSRHDQLGRHAGLKLPHHGSVYAFHPGLHTEGQGRAWWVTPFNQGVRLPPLGDEGISKLVARNKQVLMTALPRSRLDQEPLAAPAMFPVANLPALFVPTAPMKPGAVAISPAAIDPLDPIWCVAFDDRGGIAGAWRGRYALSVVE